MIFRVSDVSEKASSVKPSPSSVVVRPDRKLRRDVDFSDMFKFSGIKITPKCYEKLSPKDGTMARLELGEMGWFAR